MENLPILNTNNYYTNPFLTASTSDIFGASNPLSASSTSNTALSDSLFSGSTNYTVDFMSPFAFTPVGLNMGLPGFQMPNFGFNMPFMNPFANLPFMNPALSLGNSQGVSQNSNSDISWSRGFSKGKFTQRQNQLINEMSQRLNCNPNDLKAVMYSESNCNPQAVNPNGGATGLIQFMPSTARRLGTTTQQLRNMSVEQQLPYVEKYIKMAKRDAGFSSDARIDAGTLYSLIFLPGFAKREVLCSSGSSYYRANRGLDRNGDGHITKTDLANRLRSYA